MKRTLTRLVLRGETLRSLSSARLELARGGRDDLPPTYSDDIGVCTALCSDYPMCGPSDPRHCGAGSGGC